VNDEKTKNLDMAISVIEKAHGKGSIMRLGNRDVLVPVSVIPSGSISIDAALGVGGFPRGRVIEVYGPESGGKTTLTLHIIAEAQKLGGQAAFIDAEHALDPVYARKLGVDVDNLLVSQPDNGEQALEIAHLPDFHQPDSRKDRRDVRQSRNHYRWPRAEILFLDPRRYSPHSGHQGRRPRDRFAHPRQNREE
jgi:hypothetical protein